MTILWLFMLLAVIAVMVFNPFGERRPGAVRPGPKRCSRCARSVDRLRAYVDGRREFWVCDMCASELDILHAARVPLP